MLDPHVSFSLFKGSPPDALCQRDSGITETTAPVSNSKETLVPFSLPFTHGVLPACSPAMTNTLRFPSPSLCVPVIFRGSYSRQLLPFQLQGKLAHLAHPRVYRLGRFGFPRLWITGVRLPPLVEIFFRPHDLIDQLTSFVIPWRNAPQGRVLRSRLCVKPLLPLGRIARWFGLRVDAGRGTARSATLLTPVGRMCTAIASSTPQRSSPLLSAG
ncbi:hypothetical protein T07_6263 [Trichinella nelsoni]|uniref:Uncharacterized protein n=1 Tax=Trichinella nelsoni TaxID=6336 RepID=A0A0V0RVV2_9BILA|nr:hypothetical protein T07_6263 [Trichinella nelsoni]